MRPAGAAARTPKRIPRMDGARRRLAGLAILAAICGGTLLWSLGATMTMLAARHRELAAQRSGPCLAALPDRELAVFRAALPAASRTRPLVVRQRTFSRADTFRGGQVGGNSELWKDFWERNDEPRCVPSWSEDGPVRIFGPQDRPRGLRDPSAFWTWFREHYQNSEGIYGTSRVGFSRDGREALIEISFSCGPLCGHGEIVLLSWDGARWSVIARQLTWVS